MADFVEEILDISHSFVASFQHINQRLNLLANGLAKKGVGCESNLIMNEDVSLLVFH